MASRAVLDLIVALRDEASVGLQRIAGGVRGVATLAAGAGLAVGGALAAGLTHAIGLASDAEEMMSKFGVVFANTGEHVTSVLDQFAHTVGRSQNELRGMAATFGDTFKPLGFAESAAADLSIQMVQLATDLSSFNNISMDEALQRLQGTIIGNHENALAFGVIINENTLKAELAANGWDRLTGAALEQAKVQARVNILMRGTTDAQGDAARTAGGWANTMRRLQATLTDTATEIGSKLLPVLTPLLTDLADFAQQAAPGFIAAAESMAGGLSWAIQMIKDSWTTLQQALAGDWVDSDVIHPFHRVIGIVGQVVATVQRAGEVFKAAGGGAVGLLAALGIDGETGAQILQFRDKALAFFEGMKSGAATILEPLARVMDVFQAFGGPALAGLLNFLKTGEGRFLGGLEALGSNLFSIFGDVFGRLRDTVLEHLPALQAVFSELGTAAWEWIRDSLPGLLGQLDEWRLALYAYVIESLPGWLAALAQLGAAAWQWLVDAWPMIQAQLGIFFGNLLGVAEERKGAWQAKLTEWGQALIAWIAPMIPPLLAQLQAMANQLLAWIVAQAAVLLANFETWKAAFLAWIGPATAEFLVQWPGMLSQFLDWIAAAAGPILLQLGDWALSFLEWIIPMIPDLLIALGAILGAILIWMVSTSAVLHEKIVNEWIPAFLGWIASDLIPRLWPALQAAEDSIMEWIGKAASVVIDAAAGIGQSIIDGIINGIKGAAGGLIGAARGAAQGVAGAFTNFFGIQSPSKLMEQYGAFAGEGFAIGLSKAAASAIDAARGMSSDVAGAFAPAPLALAPASAVPALSQGGRFGGGGHTFIFNYNAPLTISDGKDRAGHEASVADAATRAWDAVANAGTRTEGGG